MRLLDRRRALMGSAGGGSFGFVIGSHSTNNHIDVTAPNTIAVRYLQRNITETVPLTAIPSIRQGDAVTVTFEHVSGDEISGRYAYTFGGIIVTSNKTVSNWAGLSASITADADASLAEFRIVKNNTGNYAPSNPPTVKVTVMVNGTPVM